MVCRLHKRMRRSLSAMPHCFCDPRLRMTASTAEAPLLGQRIPVGAFGRGAGVSPGRRIRQRTAPARNRPGVQDPWRNRRPFPAKPPKSRGGATAGKAATAVEHAGMLIGSICPCSQTNACTKRTANHRAKALMENTSRAPSPPLQKQPSSTPANLPKSHP